MSYTYYTSVICFIFLYIFYVNNCVAVNPENCYNGKIRTAGTGTVLFNPTDVYKTCWSQEELAILTARLILEDVIPDQKMISVQCKEDVDDLVEYFKVVIETIRFNTKARKRHIMLMALTDLLGGFLHHAVLPMARKAYYAGAIDYINMEKLIQLYEELKWFLRTNGQGWSKPMIINKEVRVAPIELDKYETKKVNDSCCHKLLYYEHEPLKTNKRSVSSPEKGIFFPLPFFDAKYRPTAIVVPLKRFALRNIESKRSAYILMKYFISAEKCLREKQPKHEMVQKFHNNLFTWIEKEVIPKLNDDKFYSAFGGVLRVRSTLKILGAKVGPVSCNADEGEEEVGAVPAVACSSKRNKLILIALLVVIVAWFFIGTCFICYRMKGGRNKKSDKIDETKLPKPESSTSFSSSKWSSILSRSSSKSSKSNKQLCKCCESTITEKSTNGYTSTSEYDSEKTRRKEKKKKLFGPSNRKPSYSSPCICPNTEPAVIDTKHSMKVLPSIAEMSENSLPKAKNSSLRKISFANESSGISSSDGMIPCAPPWMQSKNTVPCPVLSDKSTNYSISRSSTSKTQDDTDIPIASSTRYDQSNQNESNQISGSKRADSTSHRNDSAFTDSASKFIQSEFDPPLASSTFRNYENEVSNGYGFQSSTAPMEETFESNKNKSDLKQISTSGTVEEYSNMGGEEAGPSNLQGIKKEPADRSYYDFHMAACHSSMSGDYDIFHKQDSTKPYIFGYDFHTSTSSDLSDDDFKY